MRDAPPGGMTHWLNSPLGAYMLDWERAEFERSVVDIFGYHALQLGLPELDTLRGNRMQHRWLAQSDGAVPLAETSLITDFAALPFPQASLDLVTLPHTLELSGDPHDTLSEVERVLVPEGRVVISGFHTNSLWGFRQRRTQLYRRLGLGTVFVEETQEWIAYRRLRDWLRLLSFEVESVRFGCYRPAVQSPQWTARTAWMDRMGPRWWPIFGSVYFVVAVKRVRGLMLMGKGWKTAPKIANAPVPVANSVQPPTFKKRKHIEFD